MADIDPRIFKLLSDLRASGDSVVVVSHNNPDGDAIGSALGLALYLKSTGIPATAVLPNDFPAFLGWMDFVKDVLVYQRQALQVKERLSEAKAILCVDFNAISRTAGLEPLLRDHSAPKLMIDHHPDPTPEFNLQYSEIKTSSTAELILRLIEQDAGLDHIDKSIAEALYVGIMTDTGSFSFSCNLASTFDAVSLLIRKGLIPETVHRKVYDTFTESRMRLLGYCLSQKLIVLPDFQTAYISLTQKEMNDHHYQVGDTEGLVNFALSIQGIKVAALFTERKDHIRISLRSKGNFAVNQIAKNHYVGGGHRNAAGGNSYSSMDATLDEFRTNLLKYKDEILASNED